MADNQIFNHPTQPQAQPQESDSGRPNGVISQSVLSVVLVFLESAITLMLRFNPKLRQLAYPLVQDGVVVSIRTYLPHVQVFATFNEHGVLLDTQLPAHKQSADIMINAYSFELAGVLSNHSIDAVEKLQIRGDVVPVAQLKDFLVQLGIGGVIDQLIRKVKKNPDSKPTPEQKAEKISELKAKLSEQSAQIESLATQNARLNTQLAEAKTKQKSTFTGFIIAALVAIAAIVSHFFV
ncbi:hypothetical protein LU290_06710 [Moraxella nasibovis]|uniref:hypothetical protein n=1 Tax=Moraxella nasibovis TaxID=2904120 RepID=UPI00240EEE0B|nr:hypothetical protein [Moraxella nasibovis]WFF37950.1 hypothetical protein LU290_06710 [Moraxella nasibovis]